MVRFNATGNLKRRAERSLRKALQTYFPSWLNVREGQSSDSAVTLIGCTALIFAGEVLATSGQRWPRLVGQVFGFFKWKSCFGSRLTSKKQKALSSVRIKKTSNAKRFSNI